MLSVGQIAEILKGEISGASASAQVERSVSASSRDITPGGIFVAVRGNAADGHRFIDDACDRGAALLIVEDRAALAGRPGIVVAQTRLALSKLAALACEEPSARLKVIGITGTSGKTTINWILYHLLNEIGDGALRVGTLGSECMGSWREEGTLTSPDPISIQRLLKSALDSGAKSCVMETSSHALDQARVEDVQFDVGVFSNLSRDHLDYHRTFEEYFQAKRHLFDLLARGAKSTKGAVINRDDPYGLRLCDELSALGLVDWSFGRNDRARVRIHEVRETADSMIITIEERGAAERREIRAPFIGPHNAENVVAAFAAARALGYDVERIVAALGKTPQVPGRLERVGEGSPRVFVDYAHKPDALERVLEAVRVSTEGKLWCVFGCGGDRDRGKRPIMGTIAAAQADCVVVTSDNPRTEDPDEIIREILSSGITPTLVESDREKAIMEAVRRAGREDTVVIAGKGHEDYQIIGTTKIHFSDQEIARKALARVA
jgi:UDP-N-acetylmuramoyl-L-alanyl-D-glutamate--2,6-diaminopimelate ligase